MIGGANVLTELATWARAAHVAMSALVWASVVALAVTARREPPADAVRAAAADGPDAASTRRPFPDTVNAFVALTKPRIIVLLLITTVPAMVLAEHGLPPLWLVLATLIGGTLAAASANAINMYLDRDIDQVMRRTRHRPLPGHRVDPDEALRFGFVLAAVSFTFLAVTVNVLAATLALSAIAFYVFVYTMWLKRTTTQNIVIGGAAGAVPVLVGWAAVTGGLAWPAWVLFAMIFVWTPPHFWALAMRVQDDYAAAGVPMLPVVRGDDETRRQIFLYSLVLFGTTLVLVPVASMGPIYLGTAIALGGAFVYRALQLWRAPSDARAWKLFKFSIVYLGALFAAVAIDALVRVQPGLRRQDLIEQPRELGRVRRSRHDVADRPVLVDDVRVRQPEVAELRGVAPRLIGDARVRHVVPGDPRPRGRDLVDRVDAEEGDAAGRGSGGRRRPAAAAHGCRGRTTTPTRSRRGPCPGTRRSRASRRRGRRPAAPGAATTSPAPRRRSGCDRPCMRRGARRRRRGRAASASGPR